jgi:hypothetical protein
MPKDYHVEIALDVSKHFYKEKKQFLLTRLPTIGEGDWYSFHESERRQRKHIYKEIYCIRLLNKDTVIHLIDLVKRVKGILIECIYTNNKLIYASNSYSKQMNKDKVNEIKNAIKDSTSQAIISSIFT